MSETSLRSFIKKLNHKGKISSKEQEWLLNRLDGHDKAIKKYLIDDIISFLGDNTITIDDLKLYLNSLKGEK